MRGRKPKPTRLKVLTGNPGKRPLNPDEPMPEPAIPDCPPELSPAGQREWSRLVAELAPLRILTGLDRAALAAYCGAYALWAEATEALQKYGAMVRSVRHDRDFSDVMNFMLGELNASHMGYRANWPETGEYAQDGWLGVSLDPGHRGRGLRVTDVIPDGPADKERGRILPGHQTLATPQGRKPSYPQDRHRECALGRVLADDVVLQEVTDLGGLGQLV